MTDTDRWRRVEELFHQAFERPDSEWQGWLDSICAGDAELRDEVASLLESDRMARVFIGPRWSTRLSSSTRRCGRWPTAVGSVPIA